MPKVYLLSRTLDPILATFTGLLAYHLSETNPRSNIPPGHTLAELVPWQLSVWREERRLKDMAQAQAQGMTIGQTGSEGDVDWDKIRTELEGSQAKKV
jgi:hypothetical protein